MKLLDLSFDNLIRIFSFLPQNTFATLSKIPQLKAIIDDDELWKGLFYIRWPLCRELGFFTNGNRDEYVGRVAVEMNWERRRTIRRFYPTVGSSLTHVLKLDNHEEKDFVMLSSNEDDSTLMFGDLRFNRILKGFSLPPNAVYSLSQNFVIVGSTQGLVTAYSLKKQKILSFEAPPRSDPVSALAHSLSFTVVGWVNGYVSVLSTHNGKTITSPERLNDLVCSGVLLSSKNKVAFAYGKKSGKLLFFSNTALSSTVDLTFSSNITQAVFASCPETGELHLFVGEESGKLTRIAPFQESPSVSRPEKLFESKIITLLHCGGAVFVVLENQCVFTLDFHLRVLCESTRLRHESALGEVVPGKGFVDTTKLCVPFTNGAAVLCPHTLTPFTTLLPAKICGQVTAIVGTLDAVALAFSPDPRLLSWIDQANMGQTAAMRAVQDRRHWSQMVVFSIDFPATLQPGSKPSSLASHLKPCPPAKPKLHLGHYNAEWEDDREEGQWLTAADLGVNTNSAALLPEDEQLALALSLSLDTAPQPHPDSQHMQSSSPAHRPKKEKRRSQNPPLRRAVLESGPTPAELRVLERMSEEESLALAVSLSLAEEERRKEFLTATGGAWADEARGEEGNEPHEKTETDTATSVKKEETEEEEEEEEEREEEGESEENYPDNGDFLSVGYEHTNLRAMQYELRCLSDRGVAGLTVREAETIQDIQLLQALQRSQTDY